MTSWDVNPLEALRRECELVSSVALGLAEPDFDRPTRCPAWNVKELLGHMYRDVDRLNVALAEPAPPSPDATAVTYWRTYDPVVDGVAIADRASELAATHATGRALARAWDDVWRKAVDTARGTDRARVVETWGPALALDEFLRTRVLEVTVHGMDLADALSVEAWPTGQGLAVTREILTALLEAEPPEALGWDDEAFVEGGTGRRPLTDRDRRILGPLAGRFPLLG